MLVGHCYGYVMECMDFAHILVVKGTVLNN